MCDGYTPVYFWENLEIKTYELYKEYMEFLYEYMGLQMTNLPL